MRTCLKSRCLRRFKQNVYAVYCKYFLVIKMCLITTWFPCREKQLKVMLSSSSQEDATSHIIFEVLKSPQIILSWESFKNKSSKHLLPTCPWCFIQAVFPPCYCIDKRWQIRKAVVVNALKVCAVHMKYNIHVGITGMTWWVLHIDHIRA